jgi:capsular polysaccharide transport system permease protein
MTGSVTAVKTRFIQEFWDKYEEHKRVINAVMLVDMRTRFGRTHFSYIIAILWPLAHITASVLGYVTVNKLAPLGGDPVLFISTGLLPYIVCIYPARMIAISVIQNRQCLGIPRIKPIHLIVARFILEMLSAFIVCLIFTSTLYLLDFDIVPQDKYQAASAIGAAIYLGLGIGFLALVMVLIFGNFANITIILSMVGLYLLSGVYLPPQLMPDTLKQFGYYNPIFNLVEWLRSAYYASYGSEVINKEGVIWAANICLFIGLLGERAMRGRF